MRFEYFEYIGRYYGKGTVVELRQDYLGEKITTHKPIWKYAKFSHSVQIEGVVYCYFNFCRCDNPRRYASWFLVPYKEMCIAVKEILTPVEVELATKKLKDLDSGEVMFGWLVYIVVLLCSLIFTQWYNAWLWASVYFFWWRNQKLWGRDT